MEIQKVFDFTFAYRKNTKSSIMQMMNGKLLVLAVIVLSLCSACTRLKVPTDYVMNESSLIDSLALNEKNLVLFWTDWCRGSHYRIDSMYIPLSKEIKKRGLDLKIFLLASDSNISLEQIEKLRKMGISTYYIDKAGGFAIANRIAIKKYINTAFPDNEVERIKGIQYGIPVELLISKDLEIINEKETDKSYAYIQQILGS